MSLNRLPRRTLSAVRDHHAQPILLACNAARSILDGCGLYITAVFRRPIHPPRIREVLRTACEVLDSTELRKPPPDIPTTSARSHAIVLFWLVCFGTFRG